MPPPSLIIETLAYGGARGVMVKYVRDGYRSASFIILYKIIQQCILHVTYPSIDSAYRKIIISKTYPYVNSDEQKSARVSLDTALYYYTRASLSKRITIDPFALILSASLFDAKKNNNASFESFYLYKHTFWGTSCTRTKSL